MKDSKSSNRFMLKQIRKAIGYVEVLPMLKERNKIYLKLKEIESKYSN